MIETQTTLKRSIDKSLGSAKNITTKHKSKFTTHLACPSIKKQIARQARTVLFVDRVLHTMKITHWIESDQSVPNYFSLKQILNGKALPTK